MMLMVAGINKNNFKGAPAVTCYTCHRGDQKPKVIPSLTIQYGVPLEDPNEVDIFRDPSAPSVDQILDKYIQAIGGTQRVGNLTSYAAKGTYEGYDTDHAKVPVDIYAKAPNQRASIVHALFGDKVQIYDGRAGWVSSADKPMPLMTLTGGNLEGAKVEALATFPTRIRQAFSQWKVGSTAIEDVEVYVVQGSNAGQTPVNLYFDQKSGLLVRLVRFVATPIGTVPTQIDYSDYRDVSGVKVPFKIISTWTDGQTTVELSQVQLNTTVDAARFARPAPAQPPKLQ
jgi:outer membrane lipoprotein-sorting protein